MPPPGALCGQLFISEREGFVPLCVCWKDSKKNFIDIPLWSLSFLLAGFRELVNDMVGKSHVLVLGVFRTDDKTQEDLAVRISR